MEHGNVHCYNGFNDNFSLKGLENALYDICEQGVDIKDRKFVITTGNRGMIQVHKAIERETQGWSRIITENSGNLGAIKKVSNAVHNTSLSAGYQFTELQAPNGLIMNFVYDPSYDDRERNKIEGPDGKGVLNSYRYDIFDMGTSASPNMYICKLAGEEDIYRYIIGMRNPFGINNNNVISHDEDSAEIHAMTTVGAVVLDPTRTMSYIPSGLVG